MSKHKKQSFFVKHRLLTITLILFLIVVPMTLIPTVYTMNAFSNHTVLFEDKSLKAVKEQDVFTLEFKLDEIIETKKNEEGKLDGGKYIFSYEITPKTTVNTILINKVNAQLSIRNDKYNTVAERVMTVYKTTPYNRLVIPFNYNLDKTLLPFVKPDGPYLYIKIDYTETIAELNQTNTHTLIIKVPFDDSQTIVKPQ
ncbi:MAG: hypothetical protein ACOX02_01935 [Acholeplasmatales bacterium]